MAKKITKKDSIIPARKKLKLSISLIFILSLFVISLPKIIVASSIFVTAPKSNKKPIIRIFDAQTKQQIKKFRAYRKSHKSGINIATGDVTGNGRNEIITAPKHGIPSRIKVFSQNGKLKKSFLAYPKSFLGGVDIATGDTDDDGKNEIIVAPGAGRKSIIKIFNYENPKKNIRRIITFPLFYNGISVASGDINDDGKDEIIAGTGPGTRSQFKVFKPNSKIINRQIYPFKKKYQKGITLSSGNINGDEYNEITACKQSGSKCKIYQFGIKKKPIKKIKIHNKKKKQINLNFGYINSTTKQELIAPSNKKSLANIYQYNGHISKSQIKFNSSKKFSEIAFISDNSFNFIVYSDAQNMGNSHIRAVEAIENEKYDFALNCGDYVTRDTVNEWELFEKVDYNIIHKKPKPDLDSAFYPAYGDNEANSIFYPKLFNFYPINQLYYSFDYKNAHIISFNTEIDYSVGSDQYQWLISDLQQTDKDWKIVFFHRPAYGNILKHNNNPYQTDLQNNIVPILEQYGVNLVFNGHLHLYHRTFPLYQNQIDFDNGITYIITGLVGPNRPAINWFTAQTFKNTTYAKILINNNSTRVQAFDTYQKLKDKTRIQIIK